MSFREVLIEAVQNRSLLKEYDRLRGTNLCLAGTPVEIAVDQACGRLEHDLALFAAFVYEYIWSRCPRDE